MAEQRRADYASTRDRALGAWVAAVEEGSPAWEAGVEPGMRIVSVNGVEPRDLIDWRWEADGAFCALEVFDPRDGTTTPCELWREPGQDWGIDFTDVLFDGIRTCVNACQFCFMAMLPPEARSTLTLRDDDYRLSFLQGNFVTLTNVSDEEADRIVECGLSPMNVSIHAISPEVRRSLIGRRADRGIEVLERLLAGVYFDRLRRERFPQGGIKTFVCNDDVVGGEFDGLCRERFPIAVRGECGDLEPFGVIPHDVEGLGADRTGRA